MVAVRISPDNTDKATIDQVDGWPVKQFFNGGAKRWYVRWSINSPMYRRMGRDKALRSHWVYMRANILESIPAGHVIHHIDFDACNDKPENLELMTTADHEELHRRFDHLYGGELRANTYRHSPEMIERLRQQARLRGNNAIWSLPKGHHFDRTKALMSDKAAGESNPAFRDDLNPETINAFYLKCRSLAETARHFGCSATAIRTRLRPDVYRLKPSGGRERTFRFTDEELMEAYRKGPTAAAVRFGCSVALVLYRIRQIKKEAA